MKKRIVLIGAACLSALALCGAEKTWTGSAGDALFSSDANWSPSGAPADGDSLLFANTSAISVTNDLAGYTFSGIAASGSGAVTFQDTGHEFTLSGDVTVSGSGVLNIGVPRADASNFLRDGR